MIFFYLGYWLLTQRMSLGRRLWAVGSIELGRIVVASFLRLSVDPLFDDSVFWQTLAFNVVLFVPLALIFVCFVHFTGKLVRRLRSKKPDKPSESSEPSQASQPPVPNGPEIQESPSRAEVVATVATERSDASEELRPNPRRLDGVMRLRIVATILLFLGCAMFAALHLSDFVVAHADAERSQERQLSALDAFLDDEALQKQCEQDEAYFKDHPPSHLLEDGAGKPSNAGWAARDDLRRSMESVQSGLFRCRLQIPFKESCESYRQFDDLYQACRKRKQEHEAEEAAQAEKCAALEEQKSAIAAQIDLDDRYFESLDRCNVPYRNVNYAADRLESARSELLGASLASVLLVLGAPAIFWGAGSVLGWIVRGFRQQ